MVTHNSGITRKSGWLTSNEALQLLSDMGVGKRGAKTNKEESLDARQWLNWIGSNKVSFAVIEGERHFAESHIREVGQRYIESNGRAYSIYDQGSGQVIEYINTYQCAKIWGVKKRQAQNIITSETIGIIIGNEYFVNKQVAEHYQEGQPLPSNAVLTHQDTRW